MARLVIPLFLLLVCMLAYGSAGQVASRRHLDRRTTRELRRAAMAVALLLFGAFLILTGSLAEDWLVVGSGGVLVVVGSRGAWRARQRLRPLRAGGAVRR